MSTKYDPRRGRHKKNASRETKDWNAEHLIPPRPPWMSREAYKMLKKIRDGT